MVFQVQRRYGIEEPYEKMKAITRDRKVSKELSQELVDVVDVPDEAKKYMLSGHLRATSVLQ